MYKELNTYLRIENIKLTNLEKELIKYEGFKPKYHYVNGVLHFGIGHNCEANPLMYIQDSTARLDNFDERTNLALGLLKQDIHEAKSGVSRVFKKLSLSFTTKQHEALIMMVFQLGVASFMGLGIHKGFKKTIKFIRAGKWEKARVEALDSVWGRKHKKRSKEVVAGFISECDNQTLSGIMEVMKAWGEIAYDEYWLGYSSLSDSLQEKGFRLYSIKELKKYMQILEKQGLVKYKPLTALDSNKLYGRGWFVCD